MIARSARSDIDSPVLRRTTRIIILVVCFAVGLALTLVIARRNTSSRLSLAFENIRNIPGGMADGETAVWPLVTNKHGENVRLEATSGFLFVIAFSSDCDACKKDVEFWSALVREARDRKIPLCLLSTDKDIEEANRFVQTYGLTESPLVFDRYGEAEKNFRINMVPQYYLFQSDAKLMGRWVGLSHFNSKYEKVQHPSQMFSLTESRQ